MELRQEQEESLVDFSNTDVDSGSMVLETDGSKVTVEDEGSEFLGTVKKSVTSVDGGKLFDEADAKSEVLEADVDKKSNGSMKRVRNEINVDDSASFDWKKRKNVVSSPDDELVSVVADSEGGNIQNDKGSHLDPRTIKKEVTNCSRSRESFCRMLSWLTGIAKDPCNPAINSLPEKSKWKSVGNEELWKQVLLARDAVMLKRQEDVVAEQPNWQKIQKMHPQMYDDQFGTSYNFRDRLKSKVKSSVKGPAHGQSYSESFSSGTPSNMDKSPNPHTVGTEDRTSDSSTADSIFCNRVQNQKVPVGSHFQAVVPEWSDVPYENDPKWLGTRNWPLEKTERRILIERDPIGKGRQDSCGCQIPGSTECVRFHIAEKRTKLKIELGSAFFRMKFDEMGEDVELQWSEEEQKRFAGIVKSNPQSEEKCFWDHIFTNFRNKSRGALVSYYFNVFLLQRRAYQNRFTKDNIDSDDDESETTFAAKSSSSIFYSPTKPHVKFR